MRYQLRYIQKWTANIRPFFGNPKYFSGFWQDEPTDVAAGVVAEDDDGVVPEDRRGPLPGADQVHDIGDGVVEAGHDEKRHAEKHRDEVPLCPVEPDGEVDDESAADGAKETPPGALGEAAFYDRPGSFHGLSAEGNDKKTHEDAADDVEKPDFGKGPDVCHHAGLPRVERDSEKDHADKPEGKNDRARDTSESKKAKGALYRWLGANPGSVIFLNEDDSDLRAMASAEHCHFFGYGVQYQGAEILPVTPELPFLRMKLGADTVSTQLVGAYNATNVLAAFAVGDYFGVPRADAIAAVEAYCPANQRSQLVRTERNVLIVDAYNANPSSMAAALQNFAAVQAPDKLALLGDMRELGDESVAEHSRILHLLKDLGLPAMLVGEEFAKALKDTGLSGFSSFDTSDALAAFLHANPVSGKTLLVKGSRGIQMEKTLPEL